MDKKQVIWSRSAKKDLYAVLESYILRYKDKKNTLLFFRSIERKIELLRRNKLEFIDTSIKGICAFPEGKYHVLFGETDSAFFIHAISEV